ncbi:mammalian ependymin-related protein 1-like [Elysia marginata]|uniref:Mammalian ependymin-related protein 1-like n=1 Tax=Elysia marginata TaxID=1093978 RepID=A0AAV4EKH8_9GAST|nr:mammalian ependymin-related protein 1-like [Elysia marginata]
MQWTQVTLVFCSVAALAWTCCTPDQWEGTQGVIAGYAGYFKHGLIKEYNDVAYDFENKRSAVFLRYVNGDIEAKIKIVIRYDGNEGGILYVDNYNRGKCWKKMLEGEFRRCCIPKDVKPYGEFSIGLKGDYKVTGYNIKGKRFDLDVTAQMLGKDQCAPVGEIAVGRIVHYDVVRNVGLYDITPGIKNASVFDVPKDCVDDWKDFDLPIDIDRQDYILGI